MDSLINASNKYNIKKKKADGCDNPCVLKNSIVENDGKRKIKLHSKTTSNWKGDISRKRYNLVQKNLKKVHPETIEDKY